MPAPFAADHEFQKLLDPDNSAEPSIDLVELMFEFAADVYSDLDRAGWRAELARLGTHAADRQARLDNNPSLRERLTVISQLLYADEGFRGNDADYYDPRNSYLNDVLSRRVGIPISLGVVYQAVARYTGLDMYGVPTPAHFVMAAREGSQVLYVDPFSDGDVLTQDACRHRIERRLGETNVIKPQHFRPASTREIAVRSLRNLKAAYAMRDLWQNVLPIERRLTLLVPEAWDEQRDLGLVYLRLGQPQRALEQFVLYEPHASDEDRECLAPYVRSARQMLAEMN